MKLLLMIMLVMTLLISACQQKDNVTPDATQVAMDVTMPQEGQTFRSGDTVFIKAKVSYPGELHGYEVKLVDAATGTIVFDETQHVHADNFLIDGRWLSAVTVPTSLKLVITASIDHDGDNAKKEMNFSVIP